MCESVVIKKENFCEFLPNTSTLLNDLKSNLMKTINESVCWQRCEQKMKDEEQCTTLKNNQKFLTEIEEELCQHLRPVNIDDHVLDKLANFFINKHKELERQLDNRLTHRNDDEITVQIEPIEQTNHSVSKSIITSQKRQRLQSTNFENDAVNLIVSERKKTRNDVDKESILNMGVIDLSVKIEPMISDYKVLFASNDDDCIDEIAKRDGDDFASQPNADPHDGLSESATSCQKQKSCHALALKYRVDKNAEKHENPLRIRRALDELDEKNGKKSRLEEVKKGFAALKCPNGDILTFKTREEMLKYVLEKMIKKLDKVSHFFNE